MTRTALKADVLLLLTAVIWGAAFVPQRSAMRHIGPFTFNGIRFALGALVLLPLVIRQRSPHATSGGAESPGGTRGLWIGGLLAGLVLTAGATLQQCGMVYTTAGKGGFITGLYVVLVPILGLFIRHRTTATTWVGTVLAAGGLYFLSVSGNFEMNRGDVLMVGCAAVWAVHVLLIGWLAPRNDPLRLALIQYTVLATISLAVAGIMEPLSPAELRAALWALLYCGICSVGIGYTLQVTSQRHAPPAHAGILMSCEAIFAALTGYALLDERFGPRELLGCGLMLAGILVSQARPWFRPQTPSPTRAAA